MKQTHSTNKNTINMPVANEQKAGVLVDENTRLKEEVQSLKSRITWFENHTFGQKSKKRIIENAFQGDLLGVPVTTEPEKPAIKKWQNMNGVKPRRIVLMIALPMWVCVSVTKYPSK
jgi:hypothetical protein